MGSATLMSSLSFSSSHPAPVNYINQSSLCKTISKDTNRWKDILTENAQLLYVDKKNIFLAGVHPIWSRFIARCAALLLDPFKRNYNFQSNDWYLQSRRRLPKAAPAPQQCSHHTWLFKVVINRYCYGYWPSMWTISWRWCDSAWDSASPISASASLTSASRHQTRIGSLCGLKVIISPIFFPTLVFLLCFSDPDPL